MEIANKLATEFSSRGLNTIDRSQFAPNLEKLVGIPQTASEDLNKEINFHELCRAIYSSKSNTPGSGKIPLELYKKMESKHLADLLVIINFF